MQQDTKKVSKIRFQRKKFMSIIKKQFNKNNIICKLFLTDNLKTSELNYKNIYDLLNNTLLNPIVFENNNIFIIMKTFENYNRFVYDFSNSIKDIVDIEILKEKQLLFFQKQSEVEQYTKENQLNPKPLVLK